MLEGYEMDSDEVMTYIAGIAYYLYRQAGCPYGNNLSGYQTWVEQEITVPFNKLSELQDDERISDL